MDVTLYEHIASCLYFKEEQSIYYNVLLFFILWFCKVKLKESKIIVNLKYSINNLP
jgi:hypothetical protein